MNNGVELLTKLYPNQLKLYYKEHNLRKSGDGPGGKFNGPSTKHIIGWSKDENLQNLRQRLSDEAEPFIRYFKSIK